MTEIKKTKELIDFYAETYGVTKKQAKEELERFAEFAEKVIVDEQQGFRLGDVGTFKVEVKPEREYGIPNKPGETKIVPQHYALRFQVNKVTKDALKEYVFEN